MFATVRGVHPSKLEQIRRSLVMATTVGRSIAEELLAEVQRLRDLVRSLGGDPDA